jgi:hypothetical protein
MDLAMTGEADGQTVLEIIEPLAQSPVFVVDLGAGIAAQCA